MKNLAESLRTVIDGYSECLGKAAGEEDRSLDEAGDDVPIGFVAKKFTTSVKRIYKSGSQLCFDLGKSKVYDEYLKDYLGAICPSDPEALVDIFRKSGYTDPEIKLVLDEFWMSKDFQYIDLPKPVKIVSTVFKSKPISMRKGWTP